MTKKNVEIPKMDRMTERMQNVKMKETKMFENTKEGGNEKKEKCIQTLIEIKEKLRKKLKIGTHFILIGFFSVCSLHPFYFQLLFIYL